MTRLTTYFLATICFLFFTASTFSFAANYKLSMLPRYSTEEINARIVPLAKYLSAQTGLQITTTLTSSFDQYTKQLSNGNIDIGFQNPYIYILASDAHSVMAMAVKGSDKDKFRGIIITSASSPLKTIDELKGKRISIVGQTSAGGFLSQKLTLLQQGINVEQDCILEEAPENKQENVLFSVYAGDVDAGFVRESALHKADVFIPKDSFKILTTTAWLPNWALSVSRNMPSEDRRKISQAIQALQSGDPTLKAMKLNAFRVALDSDYDVVRKAAGLID